MLYPKIIQFPQEKNKIFKFERNGKLYAADLDKGCVVEIDNILLSILDLSETCDNDELYRCLADQYDKADILKAMKKLESFAKIGMFFSGKKAKEISDLPNEPPEFFVSPVYLENLNSFSFVNRLEKYYLLTSLAKQTELFIGANPDMDEQLADLDAIGIKKVPTRDDNRFSVQPIPEEGKGILALSMALFEEMAFSFSTDKPVISRIYSDRRIKDDAIQSALAMLSVMRPYDALCLDASWTKNALLKFVSNDKRLQIVQPGVDNNLFKPLNKQFAKKNIASAFSNGLFNDLPIVIILSGLDAEEEASFIGTIANMNQDIAFLVIEPTMASERLKQRLSNVEIFIVNDAQDSDVLPMLFNAAEVMFFPAVLGVSCFLVLCAMSCGLPILTASSYGMPKEVGDAGILIETRDSQYGFDLPVELISEKIRFLLEHPTEKDAKKRNAIKQASRFTWEKTASQLIELLKQLLKNRSIEEKFHHALPVLFAHRYNSWDDEATTRAIQLPTLREKPMLDALISELLIDHTQREVEAILSHIYGDSDVIQRTLTHLLNRRIEI